MDPVIDMALRASLALLFVAAASHKLRDRGRFRAALADYRLLPATLVPAGVLLVAGAELAVAAALLAAGLRRAGLVGAAALLGLYGAAIAINLARGRHIDCGCGSAAGRPINAWLVARNTLLGLAALAALAPVRPRALGPVDALTIAGAFLTLTALYAAADRMIAHAPLLARLRGDT